VEEKYIYFTDVKNSGICDHHRIKGTIRVWTWGLFSLEVILKKEGNARGYVRDYLHSSAKSGGQIPTANEIGNGEGRIQPVLT